MESFQDHFSKQSTIYSRFRPHYPKELFAYLASLVSSHELAWDAGTGNGQAALGLSDFFSKVYASDPSAEQIALASARDNIAYHVEKAEKSQLPPHSVDIITAAQAAQWFQLDEFYDEVKRVLKPDGVLALWCYGCPSVDAETDRYIRHIHDELLDEFWQAENRMVERGYQDLYFPFQSFDAPLFEFNKDVTLEELCGHLRSWSASQKYVDKYGENPVKKMHDELLKSNWSAAEKRQVRWTITVKVGKC